MATIKELGQGSSSDGWRAGQTTNDPGAFWGAAVTNQPASGNQAAVATSTVTTASTTTTPWGFATSTQADNLAAQVVALRTLTNQLRSDLVLIGLLKGAA